MQSRIGRQLQSQIGRQLQSRIGRQLQSRIRRQLQSQITSSLKLRQQIPLKIELIVKGTEIVIKQSMLRWQCLIHNGTLETVLRSIA